MKCKKGLKGLILNFSKKQVEFDDVDIVEHACILYGSRKEYIKERKNNNYNMNKNKKKSLCEDNEDDDYNKINNKNGSNNAHKDLDELYSTIRKTEVDDDCVLVRTECVFLVFIVCC